MTYHSKPYVSVKQGNTISVESDENGLRLDRWLKRRFPALSHGLLQKLLRTGQVRVNGSRAESSRRLAAGESVRVPPFVLGEGFTAAAAGRVPRPIRDPASLRGMVIFEDADVAALNKPAGLAVQGGTGLKENLDDSLMALSPDGKTRPKLVHRLDRDTSGVLLIARNDFAAAKLTEAFRSRSAVKIYWAVTSGAPKPAQGRIEVPLVKRGMKMIAAEVTAESEDKNAREEGKDSAKPAATLYRVLENAGGKAALVALRPLTGRTHQLRAHMAHVGSPILGDRLYCGVNPPGLQAAAGLGKGLHLHARRIVVPHPRGGVIDVTAPLGGEMARTFEWFGFDEKVADDESALLCKHGRRG